MSKTIYEVEITKSGQQKPYEDTIHEGTVKVYDEDGPKIWNDATAMQIVIPLINRYYDKDKETEWYAPKLKIFKNVGPGEWKVRIETAYTD